MIHYSKKWLILLVGLAGMMETQAVRAQAAVNYCGELENHYGPFDYRTATAERVNLVERFHFTSNVETLRNGNTGSIGGDISYTLRVFPNHVRALMAISNLGRRQKTDKPHGSNFTIPCWFDRAIRFVPDDPNVRLAYGIVLLRDGKKSEALAQMQKAQEFGGDNANLQYNLGLAYFDVGEYDKSYDAAKKAYARGYDLPGLRDKLRKVGKWRGAEPSPVKEPPTANADDKKN